MTDIEFSNYLPSLKENSRLILIVLLASCVASFLGAEILMDDHYWSEAEIQVLYGAGNPNGSQNSDRAAILVRERMTTNFLEEIIVDNGLYPQERRSGLLAKAVEAMRKDISTLVVRDNVVRLAFRATDPRLTQRITGQLAAQTADTASQRSLQEDRVLSSLSNAIKNAEADLAKQEGRVKDFNLRFLGGHLEKQTATLATLNRLILRLQSNADLLSALQEQKSSQERFLIQQPSPEPSGGPPDSKLQGPTPAAESVALSNPANPGFADRKIKIDEFNKEIDERKRQQAEIRRELAVYQAKIESAPKIRALQGGIARDYDKARLHYQELLAKKNEAEMTKAAKKQMEPTFKVLSPASLPQTRSETPYQFIAKLSGLLWGPLVAIGLIRLRSKAGEQKVGLEEVISQLGVPVLASIPWIPLGSVEQAPDRD